MSCAPPVHGPHDPGQRPPWSRMLNSFTQFNTFCDVESTPRVEAVSLQSHTVKTIGERIKQARDELGLSAEELAQLSGYATQSGISNLENRATGRGGNKINQIAAALNVTVDWLMNGPDSDHVPFIDIGVKTYAPIVAIPFVTNEPDRLIDEAVHLLSKMSASGRQEAINFLRFLSSQHAAPASPEHGAKTTGGGHSIPRNKAA